MNDIVMHWSFGNPVVTLVGGTQIPALCAPSPVAARRTLEFFTANIRNPNTRRAYARAAAEFAAWCEGRGITALGQVQPVHVAAWVEELQLRLAAPSVKQRLAALRMLVGADPVSGRRRQA